MSAFPPGRGSQLTPDERSQIQRLSLIEGHSQSEIARQMFRDRGTIANVLQADDTQALAKDLASERRESALEVLRQGVVPAAKAWVTAATTAAEKGDHRAARDLLLHTEVIAPLTDRPGTSVQIVIGMPGVNYPDPLAGATLQGRPDSPTRTEGTGHD
jgi:hypothetical protein